jgi:hypothetical protein
MGRHLDPESEEPVPLFDRKCCEFGDFRDADLLQLAGWR